MSALEPHLAALPIIVPLLVAPLAVLLRERGLAWAAATAGSACSFALALLAVARVRGGETLSYAMGSWPPPYGIELGLDAFSSLVLLVVTGASTLALLIARTSLDREIETGRQPGFYAAWLLALAGLAGILAARDAFNIFVFMEISSLATYILIAGGPRRQALTAVFKYLIMGTIGATFYLIGVGLVYMMTGTLNLADMEARLADVSDLKPVLVAAGFITVGLALKAAVFPLHAWLPNAYTYAPHAATVFIAACSTKVSLYVLLRFDFSVFQANVPDHAAQFAMFALPLAIAAMLIASYIALFERNLKRLLAYSSIAQIGYMLLGAGLLSVAGLTGGIVHMFNHALAKGGLFIAAACLAVRGATLSLDGLSGAARRMPLTMAAFVLAGLSLIGIPGTAGFISKWSLVVAAMDRGPEGLWLVAPMLASSLMAAVYVWRVVESAYFAPAPAAAAATATAAEPVQRAEAPWWMLAVLWSVALGNVYFGLQPQVPLELSGEAARTLLQPEHVPLHEHVK